MALGPLDEETYVKIVMVVFGVYALQMLLVPGKMVTDHFDAPATPLLKFWIRGESVPMLLLLYVMYTELSPETNFTVSLLYSTAVAVIYPFNAKFGYATDGKLPVKYPMHYVPEMLCGGLTAAGMALKFM